MTRRWIPAVATLLVTACTGPGAKTSAEPPAAEFSTPLVLFVSPDAPEIQQLKRELGDDFYVVADDAMWYRASAYQLLDSLQIRHTEVSGRSARFLVHGQPIIVSWDSVARTWFNLVYDGETEPRVTADIDLPEEIGPLLRQ
jgi:hypothetical protein